MARKYVLVDKSFADPRKMCQSVKKHVIKLKCFLTTGILRVTNPKLAISCFFKTFKLYFIIVVFIDTVLYRYHFYL